MNLLDKFAKWGIDSRKLTNKRQQTGKKIEYVKDYIARWANISAVRSEISTITFIDCMSNAGVYQDGDCCTAIEVLNLFCGMANRYPNKTFRIFCNDISNDKIEILKKVAINIKGNIENVKIYFSCSDVNNYLDYLNSNPQVDCTSIFGYGSSVVLFVDPFDFGTVEIPKISNILKMHYCELVFNFFVSDYVRNISQDSGRIQKCLGGKRISNKEQLFSYMRSMLRVGKIQYVFSYEFRTKRNVELYQIVFATPNVRGLEVLKESLWAVFNGAEYHRNKSDPAQITLFSDEDDRRDNLATYSDEAKALLKQEFSGQEVTYNQIEEFLIEYTMLSSSHIISNVLKPMIDSGQIKKFNLGRKNNYKSDRYYIIGGGDGNE